MKLREKINALRERFALWLLHWDVGDFVIQAAWGNECCNYDLFKTRLTAYVGMVAERPNGYSAACMYRIPWDKVENCSQREVLEYCSNHNEGQGDKGGKA